MLKKGTKVYLKDGIFKDCYAVIKKCVDTTPNYNVYEVLVIKGKKKIGYYCGDKFFNNVLEIE